MTAGWPHSSIKWGTVHFNWLFSLSLCMLNSILNYGHREPALLKPDWWTWENELSTFYWWATVYWESTPIIAFAAKYIKGQITSLGCVLNSRQFKIFVFALSGLYRQGKLIIFFHLCVGVVALHKILLSIRHLHLMPSRICHYSITQVAEILLLISCQRDQLDKAAEWCDAGVAEDPTKPACSLCRRCSV